MRTPKISALNNLIDYLNINGENIEKLSLDSNAININAWLSGFIDADGSFQVRATDAGKYPAKVDGNFLIEQRKTDISGLSLYDILSKLAEYLLTVVKSIKTTTENPKYRVRTTSMGGNKKLIDYLTLFPLFSSKYLDYLAWLEVVKIIESGNHITQQGIDKIKELKRTMNDSRTIFNWDHLNNFYSLYE